jgi:hypothetical protein
MSLPLVFHPAVQGEVDEAYRWYEQQRSGLGNDFLAAVEEVYQIIYQNVRRALPRRFPYSVFYRVHADRVEVIAVQHSRRDPRGWHPVSNLSWQGTADLKDNTAK